MEFTKRSNLGALLAAVLVGLLSLCINHVYRVQPEDLDWFLERVSQIRRELQAGPDPSQRSPLRLQDDLVQAEKSLNKMFRSQLRGRKLDTDQVVQVVGILTATANALENHEQATAQQVQQGRMLAFSGLFLAAQMMPREFSDQFRQMGDRILDTDSTVSQQEHVHLLSDFHEFNVGQMHNVEDAVVLHRLKAYSHRQTDEPLAIRLYLLISEEVSNQGRLNLAHDILAQGTDIYNHHPDKRKLTNRMIDLQIENHNSPHLLQ